MPEGDVALLGDNVRARQEEPCERCARLGAGCPRQLGLGARVEVLRDERVDAGLLGEFVRRGRRSQRSDLRLGFKFGSGSPVVDERRDQGGLQLTVIRAQLLDLGGQPLQSVAERQWDLLGDRRDRGRFLPTARAARRRGRAGVRAVG